MQIIFFMMLQTLARLPDFQEDPAWILENLKIPDLNESAIIETLKELESLEYLTRNTQGKLEPKPETLWRPDPYDSDALKVYTRAAESVAQLMQTPKVYRPSVYSSMCLAMDEENLLATEKLMIEIHHRLVQLSKESKNPTAVAHLGNFL